MPPKKKSRGRLVDPSRNRLASTVYFASFFSVLHAWEAFCNGENRGLLLGGLLSEGIFPGGLIFVGLLSGWLIWPGLLTVGLFVGKGKQ